MTPRQIAASLHFAKKLDRHEKIETLQISLLGARGEQKQITKALDAWKDE